jgi:hypothetical protein
VGMFLFLDRRNTKRYKYDHDEQSNGKNHYLPSKLTIQAGWP